MKQWKQNIITVHAQAQEALAVERCTLAAAIIALTAFAVIKALGL